MPARCIEEQTLEVCNARHPGAWFIIKLFCMVAITAVPTAPFWVWLITSTGDHGISEEYHDAVIDALRMAAALGLLLLQALFYLMILAAV